MNLQLSIGPLVSLLPASRFWSCRDCSIHRGDLFDHHRLVRPVRRWQSSLRQFAARLLTGPARVFDGGGRKAHVARVYTAGATHTRLVRALGAVLSATWRADCTPGGQQGRGAGLLRAVSLTRLVMAIAVACYFFGEKGRKATSSPRSRVWSTNGAQAIRRCSWRRAIRLRVSWQRSSRVFCSWSPRHVFVELKSSLDELWEIDPRVRPTQTRSALRILLRHGCWPGLVLLLALLLLISLVVSEALTVLEQRGGSRGDSAGVLSVAASLFSLAVIACLFAVIYKMLPDAPLSWRDVWIGAVFTAGLFSIGKYAIGLYLGSSGVASSFGAAGSLVALLLWIYYSAQIFFSARSSPHQIRAAVRQLAPVSALLLAEVGASANRLP
jgi:membrane protein